MMESTVLVIGSGGREHALCWKLADSPYVKQIYCAPGSVGISTTEKVESVDLDLSDYSVLATWCKDQKVDLVVIGPEDPLANGIVDALSSFGVKCFGPTKAGAQIEANKDFAKNFMNKYQIPTARFKSFTDAQAAKDFINTAPFPALVVKASGLAAGKGVVVAASKEEACEAVDDILTEAKFGSAGSVVVVEELLEGDEVSVLAFTDGETVSVMPPAQDHKRIGDGDVGPNTGGMGAYCPCPLITPAQLADVRDQVLQRAVDGMRADGINYVGVLYAGLMITKSGPMTLEFNCRFGDPETQVLMTLLESDLYNVMNACVNGGLSKFQVTWNTKLSAVGVVIASKGYPETSTKGCVISGLSQVQSMPGVCVFYSGVSRGANGSLVTWGGRVLCVVARGALRAAAAAATAAAAALDFPGAQHRKDIAHRAFSNTARTSRTAPSPSECRPAAPPPHRPRCGPPPPPPRPPPPRSTSPARSTARTSRTAPSPSECRPAAPPPPPPPRPRCGPPPPPPRPPPPRSTSPARSTARTSRTAPSPSECRPAAPPPHRPPAPGAGRRRRRHGRRRRARLPRRAAPQGHRAPRLLQVSAAPPPRRPAAPPPQVRAAAAAATAAAAALDFPGAQHRKDIAHRAFSNTARTSRTAPSPSECRPAAPPPHRPPAPGAGRRRRRHGRRRRARLPPGAQHRKDIAHRAFSNTARTSRTAPSPSECRPAAPPPHRPPAPGAGRRRRRHGRRRRARLPRRAAPQGHRAPRLLQVSAAPPPHRPTAPGAGRRGARGVIA
ncbi:hypothetical protein ACJJTC_010579 [Scirpophaga incertulas]